MGRQTINIQEEEDLTLEVKKFLCLYDKRCVLYKDKRAKANAWRKVEESLGLEDGKHICLYISSDLQEYSILYSTTSCVETQCCFFSSDLPASFMCVCVWGGGGIRAPGLMEWGAFGSLLCFLSARCLSVCRGGAGVFVCQGR